MTNKRHLTISIVLWLILIAVLIQAPLCPSFFTDDDFDHVRATLDNSDLHGRPNWYNYIFTSWLLWKPVLTHLRPFHAYVCLRALNILLFFGTSYLLYRLLTVMNAPRPLAVLTAVIFLLHPLAFEVHLRLSCMHYVIAMFFMLMAIRYACQYSISGKTIYLSGALTSETLCLFSSIHGLPVVPALLIVSLLQNDAGRLRLSGKSVYKTTALYLVPFILWIIVFFSLPFDLAGKSYGSLGNAIYTHQQTIMSALLWAPEPSIMLQQALWAHKSSILGHSVAVAGVLTFVFVVVLFTALLLHPRVPYITRFAIMMLLLSLFLPPKPYHMSRYVFFLLPWSSVLLAWLLHCLYQKHPRYLFVTVVIVMLLASVDWYVHQISSQRLAGLTNRHLSRLILEQPDNCSWQLEAYPQQYGVSRPWPRSTFYQLWHIQELFAFLGKRPQALTVSWSDGRDKDQLFAEWSAGTNGVVVYTVWTGPDYVLYNQTMHNNRIDAYGK